MSVAESEAWLQTFSLSAYRPIIRLASGKDADFLKTSGSAESVKAYRRRQRIFLREYLRALSRDFQRLLTIASARDREPMAHFDARMSFIFGVLWIETRLALQALVPHEIDPEPLLQSVESLASSTRKRAIPILRLHVH